MKEAKNLMRDVGAQMRVEWAKIMGGIKGGREGMLLLILGSEEECCEKMEKKMFKVRTERIEDLT